MQARCQEKWQSVRVRNPEPEVRQVMSDSLSHPPAWCKFQGFSPTAKEVYTTGASGWDTELLPINDVGDGGVEEEDSLIMDDIFFRDHDCPVCLDEFASG